MSFDLSALNESIKKESAFIPLLQSELSKTVIGQNNMVRKLLIGMLANGHVLLEGVPGLAKTLTVKTLAKLINTSFKRIQFTPDLLPADLLGTQIYSPKTGEFSIKKGPLFSNIILADEINRSPAKVQAALLESMQERQITIGDETFKLKKPFLVLATQNPIEQEGTYPLPEAQVDRFMLKIKIDYPSETEELEIIKLMSNTSLILEPTPVVSEADIIKAREVVNSVYVDEKIHQYIISLVFATRYPLKYGLDDIASLIEFGASPRASINLLLAAKANAFIDQRAYVIPDDIKAVAMDVLRHRILLTFEAEAESMTSEDIITRIFETVTVP
jgi:MoxR-like ATPase